MHRHDAVVRCLADLVQKIGGKQTRVEQWIPTMQRTNARGERECARLDVVFLDNGQPTYLDVAIVAPFSTDPGMLAAAAVKPGYMARRAERGKFNRYPGHRLVPFVLETTGRPGQHAKKFIRALVQDHPTPAIAARDVWACIQNVLHSTISQQQLRAVAQH